MLNYHLQCVCVCVCVCDFKYFVFFFFQFRMMNYLWFAYSVTFGRAYVAAFTYKVVAFDENSGAIEFIENTKVKLEFTKITAFVNF